MIIEGFGNVPVKKCQPGSGDTAARAGDAGQKADGAASAPGDKIISDADDEKSPAFAKQFCFWFIRKIHGNSSFLSVSIAGKRMQGKYGEKNPVISFKNHPNWLQ